jgi:hypothetical protein
MTVVRRVLRTLRPVVETLLAGALIGAVVMAIAVDVQSDSATSSANAELPLARAYMLAFIRNDTDTMAQLNPSGDAVSQAVQFQNLFAASSSIQFKSLTYLGGSAVGPLGVHNYVIEVATPQGDTMIPFAVTVYQGHVVQLKNLNPQTAAAQ